MSAALIHQKIFIIITNTHQHQEQHLRPEWSTCYWIVSQISSDFFLTALVNASDINHAELFIKLQKCDIKYFSQ